MLPLLRYNEEINIKIQCLQQNTLKCFLKVQEKNEFLNTHRKEGLAPRRKQNNETY